MLSAYKTERASSSKPLPPASPWLIVLWPFQAGNVIPTPYFNFRKVRYQKRLTVTEKWLPATKKRLMAAEK
ncbi:MAG: hypothetical protein AAF620_18390 [Bacteroidota bacterium]